MHKVGLGLTALALGADAVLPEHFNEARRYVSRPHGRCEMWPYLQRVPPFVLTPTTLARPDVRKFRYSGHLPAGLVFFSYFSIEFAVALRGDLAERMDGAVRFMVDASQSDRPFLLQPLGEVRRVG